MFTQPAQTPPVLTKGAMRWTRRNGLMRGCLPGLIAGIASLLAGTGCASHAPRPLVIQSPRVEPTALPAGTKNIEIKLVTFNVWGLPSWINGASPNRFGRIAGQLQTLNPDVAVLQEVWTRDAQKCAPIGQDWWTAQAARSHSIFRRTGLMTLSRHPIVGGEFRPFRSAVLPDALVTKGALKTTLELEPGVRVNLWNVHLQAGESSRAARIRCRQIAQLATWVREAEDGQVADLVAGDFNSAPESEPYQRLLESIGPGALELSHSQPICTFDGMNPDGPRHLALDHVFVHLRQPALSLRANPELTFTAAQRQDRLSDHCGLLVGLRLAPALNVKEDVRPDLAAIRHRPADELTAALLAP